MLCTHLGGGQETFGRRGDPLQFQLAVGIELELRTVGQQDRDPTARAGPHHFARRQRRARVNRLPAPFAQDFDGSQDAHDLARVLAPGRGDRNQNDEQQEIKPAQPVAGNRPA